MGSMSIWHWVIVLAIVLLLFGAKRLPDLASSLGKSIKGFKSAIKEEEGEQKAAEAQPTQVVQNQATPANTSTAQTGTAEASAQQQAHPHEVPKA
jgi:sec-independent protein translocase protein TatA